MKKALFLIALFSTVQLAAQNPSLSDMAMIQQNGNWIQMLPDSRVEADRFFDLFLDDLGMDAHYSFDLIEKSTDDLGFTHYRYQEHLDGQAVEGAVYILHVKDGFVMKANGRLIRDIPLSGGAMVTAEEALDVAKAHMGSDVFYWEMPEMEARIKHIKNDPNATFYPSPELVYVHERFARQGEGYRSAWKYELYAADHHEREIVFVDAENGEVVCTLEGCHSTSVEGTAETRYHGTQTIITDSISATEYRLFDDTRGGGVQTYDMNENVDDYSLAVDFIDDDNYWDNANEEYNDAATDAHWGSEMFYDYYLSEHGRDSYDDNGSMLVSYVHYDEDFFNAFWNGLFATYGDGDGNPLTSIDVVGHELTHGVTEYSAGLIYQYESGAINESFSDIFGTAVEAYAIEGEVDWVVGKENFSLRNMANPNLNGDPDTYLGNGWWYSEEDNGGVHTNSGVQNYWFYLLSTGSTGVNDNGDSYTIDSLGMDVAAAIAYRNLTVYLTPSSNYLDARLGAIQAAEDLYGVCSDEALEVSEAWYAVGVGSEAIAPDFQFVEVLSPLNSGCDLGAEEPVSMQFRLNPPGCGLTVEAGEEIEVSYSVNGQAPITETIIVEELLTGGEVLTHDFLTPVDLSLPGEYLIDYSVSYQGDLISSNDVALDHRLNNSIPIEGDDQLSFEYFNAGDSIFVNLGDNAEGAISSSAASTGNNGFLMNGYGASPENVNLVYSEDDNYAENATFVSKMCACVDLTGWDDAYLNFDLRQTYSALYLDEFGYDLAFMIAMRTTVDGVQVGGQWHPETNNSDPYLSHVMDMSTYADTEFTLCFEGIHFVNDNEDPDGSGDKSMLDNIYFSQTDPTGLEDNELSELVIYPNPTSGMIQIELEAVGQVDYRLVDVTGKELKRGQWISDGSPQRLDLSGYEKGNYLLTIRTEEGKSVQKVVVQ